jgi:hypothetical protein
MQIKPINKKYASLVRRYVVADRKLVETEDALTAAIDLMEDDDKLYRAERKKETTLNRLIDKCYLIWDELPAREQQNIDRQYKNHFGYGCQLGAL